MAKTPLARTSLRLTSQCRQGRAIGWIPWTPQLASQDNPICFVPGGVDSIFFPLRADWVASVMLVVLGKKSLAGSLEGLGRHTPKAADWSIQSCCGKIPWLSDVPLPWLALAFGIWQDRTFGMAGCMFAFACFEFTVRQVDCAY